MYEHEIQAVSESLIHRRAVKGLMAKFLNATMPPDPKPVFVWPQRVVETGRKQVFRTRNLAFVSLTLLLTTMGMIYLLLQVPFLDQSVVKLMTRGFETFIPTGWATGVAWIVGMVGTMSIGSFTNHDYLQRKLQSLPATKYGIYNFVLMAALWEEQAFRSGSEKWSWSQRVRASLIFGVIHITNIWYSMAAGVALGLTGFGFLLVYHWYYQKTKDQVVATAASATVHAVYNMMALALIVVVIPVSIFT